jgi:Carbohydrate esterase, sialic acid-specific acetylesterase
MYHTTRITAIAAAFFLALSLTPASAELAAGPVKIFLLSGQSNMTGRGALGDLNKPAAEQQATLTRLVKDAPNVEKYKSLYSGPNKNAQGWTVRDDVFISYGTWPHLKPEEKDAPFHKHGGLTTGYGGRKSEGIGPEFGIGHVLGDSFTEPVLLVKIAFGGTSLVKDFGPPSAAGGKAGALYTEVVTCLNDTIKNLPEVIPGYDAKRGYEIVGFFWNQGEHDMVEPMASAYEEALAFLIKDLRKEFHAPEMKVVVATTGYEGWKGKPSTDPVTRKVIEAQLATPQRAEFKGNVATTETRDFWRDGKEFGARGMSIHWNGNGESYFLIGEAMGNDMLKLLKGAEK